MEAILTSVLLFAHLNRFVNFVNSFEIIPFGDLEKGEIKDMFENFDGNLLPEIFNTDNLKSYDNIVNIHQLLSPLTTSKCFIVINNLKGVNIPENIYPVILRNIQPAIFKLNEWHTDFMWIPKEIPKVYYINENATTVRWSYPCILSKFMEGIDPEIGLDYGKYQSYCVKIAKQKLSVNSKLWSCEVQVNLFLPKYTVSIVTLPKMFNEWETGKTELHLTSVPPLEIFVEESVEIYTNFKFIRWNEGRFEEYAADQHIVHNFVPSIPVFVTGKTTQIKKYLDKSFTIENVYIISTCKTCMEFRIQINKQSMKTWMDISWNDILQISKPKQDSIKFWKRKFRMIGFTPIENDLFRHLDNCENVYKQNGALGRPDVQEKRDLALHAFTMAIMTAAKNFSYNTMREFGSHYLLFTSCQRIFTTAQVGNTHCTITSKQIHYDLSVAVIVVYRRLHFKNSLTFSTYMFGFLLGYF